MPRVSEAHLAARRQQIIDAATRCFLRKGFHQTSMQDVIQEAGLSVGAFYRYFRSKPELIRAIAESKVGQAVGLLDEMLRDPAPVPPLPVVLDRVLAAVDTNLGPDGPVRIAVQVWGEAMHDPEIGLIVQGIYGTVRQRATALAARARDDGQLPPDTDPTHAGSALFGLILGYILQRILLGDIDRTTYVDGVRHLLEGG